LTNFSVNVASEDDEATTAKWDGGYGRLRYKPQNWTWRSGLIAPALCAVFDIDGVLADAAHRQHLIRGRGRNWHLFFEMCGKDALIEEVANMGHLLDPAMRIVLCTARPQSVAGETLQWLEEHGVRWDLLVMREHGDFSFAVEFKQYTVAELRAYGFTPCMAVEDDPRNKAMFDAEGIPCIYIHSGYHS
jgi:hypothetical protein